jgi:short-subunit dehydrogenase
LHKAIDNGNSSILKTKWAVLDDTNVDLLCVAVMVIALLSSLAFGISLKLAGGFAAAVILPLRLSFPRSNRPTGLVLITGASSGIGAELSYIFAEKSHNLILVGRDEGQLNAVQENVRVKYGKSAEILALDLSLAGSAKHLYDTVTGNGHVVDILVNAAGLGGAGATLEQPIELAERMTTLNCITLVQLSQLFGKDMAKRGRGWMLQVSSVGGWIASPGQNIYHASKHYVRAFSEALSVELRAYPGLTNTQLMSGPTHTQWVTSSQAEDTFMADASGAIEDPKAVAMAGYKGLCQGKTMVFGSWNAAIIALFLQLAPRSVHLTLSSIMNPPLRGGSRVAEPQKDQNVRGRELEKKA